MQHINANMHLLNAFSLTLFASNQCRHRTRIERLFAEVDAETEEIGHCTAMNTHAHTSTHTLALAFYSDTDTHAWTQNLHICL